jgi:hypothetical protein
MKSITYLGGIPFAENTWCKVIINLLNPYLFYFVIVNNASLMEAVLGGKRHDTKNIAKATTNEGTLFLLFFTSSRSADRDDKRRC